MVPSAVLSTVPASSRAVRRLVLMSSQAPGVLGGEPTNTPTVPVIDMTEADSVKDENWDGTFRELDSDTVSVESLVGSAVEVPQSGDEVMSDPDPEVVEALSSAAVQLALSTLDEVDFTRIFRLRATVMKTIPGFLRGPFRTALRMAMTEAVHPILLRQERGWKSVAVATPQVAPPPPLRDWAPTLLRAHGALLHWSSRLDALLCGPLPVSDRSLIVEEIFNNLITILLQHAPSQCQFPRRRQPVWWTSECFAACVARNGAWRDFRRTQDPRDRNRFCVARTHFHRTVRSCQDSFWSHWQDRVANLSRVNPRAAAREVRHTFRQGQSRRDQTHCVRWPEGQDPLEQWRQHFMSVGSRTSSSFDPSFHADVMRRFADLCALPPVSGVF